MSGRKQWTSPEKSNVQKAAEPELQKEAEKTKMSLDQAPLLRGMNTSWV